MNTETRSSPRDEVWFEDLFVRHHAAVRAYCSRRLGSAADDTFAEVFLVAWRKRDAVPPTPLPWLYGVAAREVLRIQRTESRRQHNETRAGTRRLITDDPFERVEERHSNALDGRYVSYEMTCFESTFCGAADGSAEREAGKAGTLVNRGSVPLTSEPDADNPRDVAPVSNSQFTIEVSEGTHWRLYAVYTDAYAYEPATLEDGRTLGIPGIENPDFLPVVLGDELDGEQGWISYADLNGKEAVELTASGVEQEPLTVFAPDGVTEIGLFDINAAAAAG